MKKDKKHKRKKIPMSFGHNEMNFTNKTSILDEDIYLDESVSLVDGKEQNNIK